LQIHREFETPVEGDEPELDKIADPKLRRLLADERIARRLAPLFVTEFRHTVWPLHYEGSLMELAFDEGEIRADNARLPLSEIELTLLHGRPEHLFEPALAIHETLPITLGAQTKRARGYALTASSEPQPVKVSPTGLAPTMSARDAFTAVAQGCLAQMRANEAPAKLERDPEGIHQLRVGLRRLQALVTAYRDKIAPESHEVLSCELRWLQQELDPARDWDVFMASTLEPITQRMPELQPGLEAAKELRNLAQARARSALDSPRYTAMLLRCYLWLASGGWASAEAAVLDRSVGDFAAAIPQRQHRRLRKFGGKRADLSEAELHRLRLMAKTQRYISDFFCELFPRKARGNTARRSSRFRRRWAHSMMRWWADISRRSWSASWPMRLRSARSPPRAAPQSFSAGRWPVSPRTWAASAGRGRISSSARSSGRTLTRRIPP
jgi:inorganic triphosphatase YgiF